jgi:hypothetical protein
VLAAAPAHADDAPPPSKGFQLAVRTGASVPFGQVSSTVAMSDSFSVQVPLIFDIGAKPLPWLFVGGFLGTAIGGAAGQVLQTCQALGVSCLGVGARGGVIAEYNARPGEAYDPWFGVGFGYEIGASSGSNNGNNISNSYRGFEYIHFLGGVDFRLQEWFGIGPFLDASVGSYDFAESQSNTGGLIQERGGTVTDKSLHIWLTLGVRIVMFP